MDHLPNDKPNKQTPNFSGSGLAIGAALGRIFSLMLFEDTALLAAGIVIGAARRTPHASWPGAPGAARVVWPAGLRLRRDGHHLAPGSKRGGVCAQRLAGCCQGPASHSRRRPGDWRRGAGVGRRLAVR